MHNTSIPPVTEHDGLSDRKSHRSRRRQAGTHLTGRRGPGIFRPTPSEQFPVPLRDAKVNKSGVHFKPSLTPGLGTRRVVGNHAALDSRVKFSMEPRAGDEAFHEWREAMRRMARLGDGLPKFVRRRVWSTLADRQLTKQHVDWDHVVRIAFNDQQPNPDDENLGSQIVKDLHRTGCDQFGSDEDRAALKRVLLAYARWNKRVGYCQGFNVIAAAILDVTDRDEKEAFKIMVYLIDYVLPESYFAQNLQALSVDIAVFRHLLQARLPRLARHLDALQCKAAIETGVSLGNRSINASELGETKQQAGYEPPLMNVYIIQWFLTLFATCLASDAVLRIWDSIMLEGSEVILRTAVVMMEFLSSRLLRLKSADQFYAAMSDLMIEFAAGRIVSSQELLFEIYEMAPFPTPHVKELREKFMYNIAPLVPQTAGSLALTAAGGQNTTGPFKLLTRWKSGRTQSLVVVPNATSDKRHKSSLSEKKPHQSNKTGKAQNPSMSAAIKSSETALSAPVTLQANISSTDPETAPPSTQTAEDEYQEVSLNTDIDEEKRSHSTLGSQHSSSVDKTASTSQTRLHANAMSEPYACSDDEWSGTQERSSSCFANLWPRKLLSIEHAPKRRMSMRDTKPGESISLDSLSISRNKSMSEEQRRHSLSPQAEYSRSDISDLGPGAVGEVGAPRPGSQPPLAHQARMSTNLTELKSIYRKQLARQRETKLRLPGLWQSGVGTNANTSSCLANACMTAVLPQKKECRTMTLETSLDADSTHLNSTSNTPISPEKEEPMTDSKTTRDSKNIAKKEGVVMNGSELTLADPDLVGAVQSWRAKAVWTCEPMPPDGCTADELIGTERMNSKQVESKKPKPTLLALASRSMEQQTRPSDQVDKYIMKSDSFESDCSMAYESAKSYPTSPEISAAHVAKNNTTPCQKQPDCESETKRQDFDRSHELPCDLDTSSSYISASQIPSFRVPWKEASASFVSRRPSSYRQTHTGVASNLTHLPLPLSPKRRSFGAQFGMYKSVPSTENVKVWSNFSDRVQTIGFKHRLLSR